MSINVSELRIGNWVVGSHSDYPATVGNHQVTGFDLYAQRTGHFAPIPLTPEILGKAGFKEYKPDSFVLHRGMKDHCIQVFEFHIGGTVVIKNEYEGEPDEENDKYIVQADIEHLHQLQNLYFALTGEELQIEL